MARWTTAPDKFAFHSSTVGDNGIKASFDLNEGAGYWEQDISAYKEKAKEDREFQEVMGHRKDGYRKFATIPDSVALKLLEDHGMDLHDPEFMSNPANMSKLKRVMLTEYRDLVINT